MLIVLFKGTFVKFFIEKSIRYWSYMKPPVIFSHDEQLSYQVFWKLNHLFRSNGFKKDPRKFNHSFKGYSRMEYPSTERAQRKWFGI